MTIQKEALADAMRERRRELYLSQRAAHERSKELDVTYLGGDQRTFPGVSLKTWANLEACKTDNPYPHTLVCVDATLDWPEGTARAIFYDEPVPEGPSFRERVATTVPESNGVDTSMRTEVLQARVEVSELGDKVAALTERFERIEDRLDLVLKTLRGDL